MSDEVKSRQQGKSRVVKFERAPYAQEIFNDEGQRKFNELASWQRKVVEQLVDGKDWKQALRSAGMKDLADFDRRLSSSLNVKDALVRGGITADTLVDSLKDCLNAEHRVLDKHGNLVTTYNLNIKLKAIDMIAKLLGLYDKEAREQEPTEELFADTHLED